MMKRGIAALLLILIGILSVVYFLRSQTKKTQDLMNELVRKIELYKVNIGSYPEELKDLVPEYYEELPTTIHNLDNQFTYKVYKDSLDRRFFEVRYNESLGVMVTYDSRIGKWIFDD